LLSGFVLIRPESTAHNTACVVVRAPSVRRARMMCVETLALEHSMTTESSSTVIPMASPVKHWR